jgi:hypothetical protein
MSNMLGGRAAAGASLKTTSRFESARSCRGDGQA